ncbi:MAG: ACP S-malonyltransferase [Kineothrix sp.]|nr:ACP S-malonyltransferase [Kineothrix sp.]NBI90678.1 [acyl-carrier-protein] S-malonyltransferase [Lachnospiraceae bacterium]
MGKTAFIFPGQGAQYIGMGKDFYEQIPVSRKMFDLASKASDLDVAELCFEENTKIDITEYTQIAMLAMEVAVLKAVEEKGYTPDVAAGLSLGEYGALVASGAMSGEDAFRVVRKRGIYMQEAVPHGGGMAAVLGLDADIIEKICEETDGIVGIANYNCPGQIVITGQAEAVDRASQTLAEAGARRCIPLNVSGPFHSIMLKEAGEKLGAVLEETEIHDIRIPYLANVTADYVTDKNQVKQLLMQQVASSVRWQQSVERMIADGVDSFVEIGPGKTLSGFMRKINRNVKVINIEKVEDLEKLCGNLG